MKWGVVTIIAGILALGLILRYGKSSHFILSDIFTGVNEWFKTLSLSSLPGNNP